MTRHHVTRAVFYILFDTVVVFEVANFNHVVTEQLHMRVTGKLALESFRAVDVWCTNCSPSHLLPVLVVWFLVESTDEDGESDNVVPFCRDLLDFGPFRSSELVFVPLLSVGIG